MPPEIILKLTRSLYYVARKQLEKHRCRAISHIDVEDLVQDGLYRILQVMDRWKPGGTATLETYCMTCGIGAIKDSVLRNNRTRSRCRDENGKCVVKQNAYVEGLESDVVSYKPLPSTPAFEYAELDDALTALSQGKLTASTRYATIKFLAYDEKQEDISKELGLTKKGVQSRIARTVKMLRGGLGS